MGTGNTRPAARPSKLERFDDALRARRGGCRLAGVDEAGRGPLAGPVVAAAVELPANPLPVLRRVRDSKLLSASRREELFPLIRRSAARLGVGWAGPGEIDEVNILQATFRAMRRAIRRAGLEGSGVLVMVDGNRRIPDLETEQETLVSGDRHSLCVACASIVAKVVRDRWMGVLDREHPGYGLAANKGYGTEAHFEALGRLGPSRTHRRSFLGRFLQPSLSI